MLALRSTRALRQLRAAPVARALSGEVKGYPKYDLGPEKSEMPAGAPAHARRRPRRVPTLRVDSSLWPGIRRESEPERVSAPPVDGRGRRSAGASRGALVSASLLHTASPPPPLPSLRIGHRGLPPLATRLPLSDLGALSPFRASSSAWPCARRRHCGER